jgi:predicted amidohydrolase
MTMQVDRRAAIRVGGAAALAAASPLKGQVKGRKVESDTTYGAIAMQLTARSLERLSAEQARAAMLAHIAELEGAIRSAAIFVQQYSGLPAKLIVLPEYLFTSYPGRVGLSEFAAKVGWAPDGPEYAAMGALAQKLGMYIAGNAYETDKHFPGFYFQTSFVVAPSGDTVLRYRRLLSMFAPSPHDVWARYLDNYGLEGTFPVAKTEIGRIAAIASEEILYPEVARALGLRGAEVFVHSSSEIGSPLATPKDIAKRARAFENMAYVVSANTAGISGTAMPAASADGNSQVVDWKGQIVAQSGDGETFTAFAGIDLASLRKARRRPGMVNMLARQRPALFAAALSAVADTFHRPDGMIADGAPNVPERDYFLRAQEAVIARLDQAGVI